MSQAAICLAPSQPSSRLLNTISILGASLFIAVCAQIQIPLFFTPVPLTMQTFAILLVGGLLGSKKGSLAVLAYISEGLFGLPVFAGGASGIASLMSPSGGYIVAYLIQAYLAGLFFENCTKRTHAKTLFAMVGICALHMSLGCFWLATYVGWQNVFVMGFLPFIPGEILKSLAIVAYFKNR